jgi:dimethylhistidine N-methyltransferase
MLRSDDTPMATRADPAFRADVLAGLGLRQKAIPARWFYDRRGSELFEEITALPEYYPTRAETAILRTICPELVGAVGDGVAVVEFGSGSSVKTPIVLNCIEPAAYVPIDISGEFLRSSAATLSAQFPGLPVLPVEADFMKPVPLPEAVAAMPKLGFFPGSTIGNMEPLAAITLLGAMRDWLGQGAMLLIGIDRIKDAAVLTAAYNDAAGVTAAFNLNLLHRINRELAGTVPVDAFVHEARWNDDVARIEMHLRATRDVDFTIDGQPFAMTAGETIHTENSHKYGDRDARLLLRGGGWTPRQQWCGDGSFCVILAEALAEPIAP